MIYNVDINEVFSVNLTLAYPINNDNTGRMEYNVVNTQSD